MNEYEFGQWIEDKMNQNLANEIARHYNDPDKPDTIKTDIFILFACIIYIKYKDRENWSEKANSY